MKLKRILSFILCIAMLISVLPQLAFAKDTKDPRTERRVYLHIQGNEYIEPEADNPPEASYVYLNENADVFLAVDNPNKGEKLDDSGNVVLGADGKPIYHEYPQYDMNGYTVKITYDTNYFTYKGEADKPFDYTYPNTYGGNLGEGSGDVDTDKENPEDRPPQQAEVGFLPVDAKVENNGSLETRKATIFVAGTYFPTMPDNLNWYNLLKLPLEAKKQGNTEISIELFDEDKLELFAKDENSVWEEQFFETDVLHNGKHKVYIRDRNIPQPPISVPKAGRYTLDKIENGITLYCEHTSLSDEQIEANKDRSVCDKCIVTYAFNKNQATYETFENNKSIKLEKSQTIYCKTQLKTDLTKVSNIAEYEYHIVPKAPHLFFEEGKDDLIPNNYSDTKPFSVYVADNDKWRDIIQENDVFYTFAALDENDALDGTEPSQATTKWVKVDKDMPVIDITKSETVRLITRGISGDGYELSDIAEYRLGIRPAPVKAEPVEALYPTINRAKVDVTLKCDTPNAIIYYTTDGSNPIASGNLYDSTIPITLTDDTVIRAVAYYDGHYSDITAFDYLFDYDNKDGVTAFHPSGVYEGSIDVTLTANNPESKIKYSIDGGEPIIVDNAATQPIIIDKDTVIEAVAINNGVEGTPQTFTYKIKPLPPVFSPNSSQFTIATNISIYCEESTAANTDRFTLYYTTDGSDPTLSSSDRKTADSVSDVANIMINDYTVIKAAVLKDGVSWSNVVTNSYDIVTTKPVRPVTTLLPGHYTMKIGQTEPYSTQFLPVPEGIEIYYTYTHDGDFLPDPTIDEKHLYKKNADGSGQDIPIDADGNFKGIVGKTVIKAIAVNTHLNTKSDVAIFEYVIAPEAPIAPPSAKIDAIILPRIPVSAVAGSDVTYEINGQAVTIDNCPENFYINLSTGIAENADGDVIGEPVGETNSVQIANLKIKATLNGVDSETRNYRYESEANAIAAPYADKASGMYEDSVDDSQFALLVTLNSINGGMQITYRVREDKYELDGLNWKTTSEWSEWQTASKPVISLKNDAIIQAKVASGTTESEVVSYVYKFKPLAPTVSEPSGRYVSGQLDNVTINYQAEAPQNKVTNPNTAQENQYQRWYRLNGDTADKKFVEPNTIGVEYSMSFKAYVKDNATGRVSDSVIAYYIIESGSIAEGSIFLADPYYMKKRISSHKLNERTPEDYASGIKLSSTNPTAEKHYRYSYKLRGDEQVYNSSSDITYTEGFPIMVTENFEYIDITMWLVDKQTQMQIGEKKTEHIEFVKLKVPVPDPYSASQTEYSKGTAVSLKFDEEYIDQTTGQQREDLILYYTINGQDPTDPKSERYVYTLADANAKKAILTIDGAETIKTAYYSACNNSTSTCVNCKIPNFANCDYGVYGKVGTYYYNTKTTTGGGSSGGGGGGGATVDKTRKYTKDMFGTEHPTHIGYINGYPDGSVQPDGNITREEVTSILYRVRYKEYNEPFVATGTVFPDVAASRWSVNDIEFMADKEVVYGYPDGEFKPSRNLSRAEFAALIRRFTGLTKPSAENVFPDLDDTHWAYEDIMIVAEAGLMQGYEDGTFRAERSITRAEVMKVVNIILGRCPDESYVKGLDFNPFNDLNKDAWHYVTVLEATITHDYYLNNKQNLEIKWENWK